nr:hypothetical protein [Candidatus Sigynarchaeota archaeon]
MRTADLVLRNCNCLDPQHGKLFVPQDLFIVNGRIGSEESLKEKTTGDFDAGGRIVVPGGIFPSFRLPLNANGLFKSRPGETAKNLVSTGFTTVVVEGLTPFRALDMHRFLKKLPAVNKIPMIDVGNFQFMTGFLKNGIINYASSLASLLLEKFKGFGISCLGPGTTTRWKSDLASPNVIFDQIPLVNASIEKIVSELTAVVSLENTRPALLVETGIEGLPGSIESMERLLKELGTKDASGKRDKSRPAVALKQLARAGHDQTNKGMNIEEHVSSVLKTLQEHEDISGFTDLPGISSAESIFIDFSPSFLQGSQDIVARGIIEGELFQCLFKARTIEKRGMLKSCWLSGMKMLLDMPETLKKRLSFSIMPQIIQDTKEIIESSSCLLNSKFRSSFMKAMKVDFPRNEIPHLFGDKVLSLPDYIHATRTAPAHILGLDDVLGGLAENQIGDVAILDASPRGLEDIISDPSKIRDLLGKPYAVIKNGNLVLKNGVFSPNIQGFTILRENKPDASIINSIEENLEKQFLKYYSTHENSKLVPEKMVEPVLVA